MNRTEFEKRYATTLKRIYTDAEIEEITSNLPYKDGILLHDDFFDGIEDDFTGDEVLSLLVAIREFVRNGAIPDFPDRGMRKTWRSLKHRIEYDQERYHDEVIKNRIKSIQRGEGLYNQNNTPPGTSGKPPVTILDMDNGRDTDNGINTECVIEGGYKGETVYRQEILQYCNIQGYTFDVDRFLEKNTGKPNFSKNWQLYADRWNKTEYPQDEKRELFSLAKQKGLDISKLPQECIDALIKSDNKSNALDMLLITYPDIKAPHT